MDRIDAHKSLVQLHFSFFVSAGLYVVTMLRVADHLANGISDSDEIAEKEGVDPDLLYRIMRLLSGYGVFRAQSGRHFALTELSDLLRSDVSSTFAAFVEWNSQYAFQSVLELLPAVRNGEVAFENRFGKPAFDYMFEDPERVSQIQKAFQGMRWPETDAVLNACDFSSVGTFADIGGGHGDVAIGFLKKYENRNSIVFDVPQVAGQTTERVSELGLEERCKVVSGDFFESVPVDADVYFLRHILHDWNDDRCVDILKNIAKSAQPGSRVLIAEALLSEPNSPDIAMLFDMEMMLFLHGRERSTDEYRALLEAAGFEFSGVTQTGSIISVVEGTASG